MVTENKGQMELANGARKNRAKEQEAGEEGKIVTPAEPDLVGRPLPTPKYLPFSGVCG